MEMQLSFDLFPEQDTEHDSVESYLDWLESVTQGKFPRERGREIVERTAAAHDDWQDRCKGLVGLWRSEQKGLQMGLDHAYALGIIDLDDYHVFWDRVWANLSGLSRDWTLKVNEWDYAADRPKEVSE